MSHVRMARPDDIDAVRALCRDYRALLVERSRDMPAFVATYYAEAKFETLLKHLPGLHARPDGAIYVGTIDDTVVACGMTHRIDATTTEIKRVFVAPSARGHGLAKGIVRTAMRFAKLDGYTRMVLDSYIGLPEAIALYRALGFQPCAPFYKLDPQFKDHIPFFDIAL